VGREVQGGGHLAADADAFGDAAVFGVVEAGVGDLEAGDGGLDGWDFGGEAGLADGLAVAQAGDFGGDDVLAGEGGVDALQAGEAVVDEAVVGPGEAGVGDGQVVGDVDDGVRADGAQVGEFDDAWDVEVGLGDVDPEVGADGAAELEDDADDADVMDGLVALLPLGRQIGDERRDDGGGRGADDGVGWDSGGRGFGRRWRGVSRRAGAER
jgi:hypothetical protein